MGDQGEDKEPGSGGMSGCRVKPRLEVFQAFSISGAGQSWMPVMDGAILQCQEVREIYNLKPPDGWPKTEEFLTTANTVCF